MFCVRKRDVIETFLLCTQNVCFIEFSEPVASKIYFELASILSNPSSNFSGFTVIINYSKLIAGICYTDKNAS